MADAFWAPLMAAFPDLERRPDIFFAGQWDGRYDGGQGLWVSSHYLGTFAADCLGVPACGAAIQKRVMAWWRCEAGLLVENWVFIDLPHLMLQMGVDLLARIKTR